MKLAIQITSSWCIDAYVLSVRPLVLTDVSRKAKTFDHADRALAYAAQLPEQLADFAPRTTFQLVRLD